MTRRRSPGRLRRQASAGRAAVSVYLRAAPVVTLLRVALSIIAGVIPVGVAWLTRSLLDRLIAGDHGAVRHDAVLLALGLALLGAIAGVGTYATQYLDREIARRLGLFMQAELFSAVVREPGLAELEDPEFHNRLQLARQSSQVVPAQLTSTVPALVQASITVAGFTASLIAFSPLAAVLVLGSVVPSLYAQLRLSQMRSTTMTRNSPRLRRQLFYSMLLLDLPAAKEIRLFKLGGFFRARMLAELRDGQRADRSVDRSTLQVDSGLSVLTAVVAGTVLVLSVLRLADGDGQIGDLAVVIAALAAMQSTLASIVTQISVADQALTLFGHYLDVTAGSRQPVANVAVALESLREVIRFDGVWFRYHDQQPWVLRDLSLDIVAGRSLAVVGLNGAGKSTIVKLLCRLYEPTRGRITWDGVDIATVDVDDLRQRIGTVFQDHVSYDLSATDNIAIGDLSAPARRVAVAAGRAGIHDVLAALPAGYQTMLSRTFSSGSDLAGPDQGVILSGGQWQRVALARALMRADADLLILDEPSSGLDARAEHEIHHMLRRLRTDRTSLLISHRLNTIRGADRIVVLAGGQVAEAGDHRQLMIADGTYAELFRLQADGYAEPMHLASDGASDEREPVAYGNGGMR
jgi:ATP-binding cassette, subfamily B, bacterial